MTTSFNFSKTEKTISYNNGKTFTVYSKETKKGIRFYRFSSGRMIPVSKNDLN